jgi:hypothetical protein
LKRQPGKIVKNHYIRLAEIVQEGVSKEFAEMFRDPGRKVDLEEALAALAMIRSVHQECAAELWRREGKVSDPLRRQTALADLCGFFAACLSGGAGEFRETALEAMDVLGYPGGKEIVRLLARQG